MFHRLSKQLEFRQKKYSTASRIFNSLLRVWISRWNTVYRDSYITSKPFSSKLFHSGWFQLESISSSSGVLVRMRAGFSSCRNVRQKQQSFSGLPPSERLHQMLNYENCPCFPDICYTHDIGHLSTTRLHFVYLHVVWWCKPLRLYTFPFICLMFSFVRRGKSLLYIHQSFLHRLIKRGLGNKTEP